MPYSQGLMHQSFVHDLLEGKFEDEALIVERLKILGLKFKNRRFIINVDIQNLDKTRSTLPFFREEIESKLANAKAIIYNQNIVILAGCENERHFLEIELHDLIQFVKANNLQAGISRSFSNLTNAQEYYLESIEALNLGNHLHEEQHFFKYEDYLVFDLINNYSPAENRKKLIHPSLVMLIEYDKENGTEYARSLYTYLCAFKNIKDSADVLNIHRNTMFHRIEKIETLLNVDLNNGDILFQLYLSYKILEFLKIGL